MMEMTQEYLAEKIGKIGTNSIFNKFDIGDILLIIEDIASEEVTMMQPYLSKGTRVKIVNIFSDTYHVLDMTRNLGLFGIIQEDFDYEKVIGLSDMREEKLNQLI